MEKYGIQSVVMPSQAETPVKLTTNVVIVADNGYDTEKYVPRKCSSLKEFEGIYKHINSSDNTVVVELGHLHDAAKWVFDYAKLDNAWFINTGDNGDWDDADEAIDQIDKIYEDHGVVPNIVIVPWTDELDSSSEYDHPAVHAASKCANIADHFKAQVFYDVDVPAASVETIDSKTIRFKPTSMPTKACADASCYACIGYWPADVSTDYPMSLIAGCARAIQDSKNAGGVPSRSVGNLEIPIDSYGVYTVNSGTRASSITLLQNNKSVNDAMAAAGFVIARNAGQKKYRIWGDHTAAVSGDGQVDDEAARFDSYIAMAYHIANRFILKWQNVIDDSMTLSLRNDIINEEQDYLNYLKALGAIVGNPKCEFRTVDNTSDSLALGQFYWTDWATYSVPAKYLELKVVHTSEGLSTYVAEEE